MHQTSPTVIRDGIRQKMTPFIIAIPNPTGDPRQETQKIRPPFGVKIKNEVKPLLPQFKNKASETPHPPMPTGPVITNNLIHIREALNQFQCRRGYQHRQPGFWENLSQGMDDRCCEDDVPHPICPYDQNITEVFVHS